MIKTARRQSWRWLRKVAIENFYNALKAIEGDIMDGQLNDIPLQLQSHQMDPRHTVGQAKGRGPHPCSHI